MIIFISELNLKKIVKRTNKKDTKVKEKKNKVNKSECKRAGQKVKLYRFTVSFNLNLVYYYFY